MVTISSLKTFHYNSKCNDRQINKQSQSTGIMKTNNNAFMAMSDSFASYNKALINFKGTKPPVLNSEIIHELTSEAREINKKTSDLKKSIGYNYRNWLENDYQKAFTIFTEELYNNADSIEELIQFRPDWVGSKLIDKFESLHPDKTLTIGNLPESFISKDCFNQLAARLTSIIEQSNPNYPLQNTEIEIEGSTFIIEPLRCGATTKKPFLITTPDGEKFVIKIDPKKDCCLDGLDSVGQQAIIDYYLSANNCQNSSKMNYYDHKYNISVNEFIEKDPNTPEIKGNEIDIIFIHKNIPDLLTLNMKYNDIMGNGNIIKQDNNYIMIDSGHCTFDCPLKPVIKGYNKKLPNSFDAQAKLMNNIGLKHMAASFHNHNMRNF